MNKQLDSTTLLVMKSDSAGSFNAQQSVVPIADAFLAVDLARKELCRSLRAMKAEDMMREIIRISEKYSEK